jgi:hypothetical protein
MPDQDTTISWHVVETCISESEVHISLSGADGDFLEFTIPIDRLDDTTNQITVAVQLAAVQYVARCIDMLAGGLAAERSRVIADLRRHLS